VDPPFDTGGAFDYLASIPGAPDGAPRIAVPAYQDARGLDAWLDWFHGLARCLDELLADGGSLYVHLDAHAAHYAKVLLDEVFGEKAFQREIVWRIGWVSGFKSRARAWIRNHDTLLFYAKGGRPATFHKEYVPYPPGYVRRDGVPPRGPGYPIEDVWNASELDRMDSIQIVSFSGEKVGYPTQKNESLVSRIVRASSSPGDLVLDCFVGSGTTAVVAQKLGRGWVACDAARVAIHATRRRLLASRSPAPFVLESVVPHAAGASDAQPPRQLAAHAHVDGRDCTIELEAFSLPAGAVPAEARAAVSHWSQWIDGWCLAWEHRGGPFRPGTALWRAGGRGALPLTARHRYAERGRREVLVRVYDVLGGDTTTTLSIDVHN
jgi:site-specific DNA-methyltransferase (adenine-specific)/adenine-specific DNA-methyltransferase